MRDGLTEKMTATGQAGGLREFLAAFTARLVVLSGRHTGEAVEVVNPRTIIGRGPGVDLAYDTQTMSRQHAAIEFSGSGFRIVDLGSTNGVIVNGNRVRQHDLGHGDRFEIGGQAFQLVVEQRETEPDTYDLTADV